MSQPTKQRPPQVTLASGIIIFASVVVVLSAWERVSTLGSLETQQAITEFLAEPRFAALGLDVGSTSQLLRISCLIAAASACATAILGWYVRKPDRAARLGLTIFAVPVFITGFPAGGLSGSFVAAGAAMLWLVPAKEWFATGQWTPPPAADKGGGRRSLLGDRGDRDTRPGPGSTRSTDAFPPPTSAAPPPAARPFGEPRTQPEPSSQAPAALWQQHHQAELHDRPGAMIAAFVITVVTAGGLLTLSLLWLAVAGLSPDFLRSVLEQRPDLFDEGLDLQEVRQTVVAYAAAFIVWCVVALTLAGFAMARRDWARRGLMVVAAFSAGGCVVFALTLPLVLIPAAAAVATVVCLRRVEVRRWFSPPSH